MDNYLSQFKTDIYDEIGISLTNYEKETESREYAACKFKLNSLNIICRNAKITPTKVGQFVTFWKRKENGPIEPFHESDSFDYYVIICKSKSKSKFGQFVFPKSILIKKGILSTELKEGKRAFRVYPKWDVAKNKQAARTQKWQLDYFLEISQDIDIEKVNQFFSKFTK